MPVPLDLLRIVRSTLLYDTLAARLHRRLSDKVFLRYLRQRGRRLAKRLQARARRVGVADAVGAPWEHLSPAQTVEWVIAGLEALTFRQATVAKGAAAARALLEMAGLALLWLALVLLAVLVGEPALRHQPALLATRVVEHPASLGLCVVALIQLRRARYRLEDADS